MATLIDAVKTAGKRAFCSLQSTGYNAWYLFSKIADGDILAAGKFADASNGLFCNNPVPLVFGSSAQPPFSGGQCNTLYRVQFQYTHEAVTNFNTCDMAATTEQYDSGSPGNLQGPITAIQAVVRQVSSNCGGVSSYNIDIVGANGVVLGGPQLPGQGPNPPVITNIVITRADGMPDSCGSLPPVVPPYEPGSTTIVDDITYEPEGGGTQITIPATVVLGFAFVDIDANIRVPVTVNLGGIKIPLTLNVTTGDINLGGIRVGSPDIDYKFDIRVGGPGGITTPPGVEPPIGPPPGEPDYPELDQPPEPDSEPIIIGAVVTTTNITGRRDLLYQGGGNPNIEIPRLGFIQFLNYVPGLGLAWSEDIPVKNLRHLIRNPWPYGAVAVEGSPRNGVSWTITPVYKQAQFPIEYPDLVAI